MEPLRVPMQLEVRVWGMDSAGKPFSQTARTIDISGTGARLEGVAFLSQVGEVIGVQYRTEKARFRVMWIGGKDTAEEGQIAIASLDAGKCIWGQALQGAGEAERRRYPRYHCIGKVLLRKEGTDNFMSAKLTDIGLAGCYVETFSPLSLETPVEVIIQAHELEIRALGVVRTLHPSIGNGIAFTQLPAEHSRGLEQLIDRVSSPVPHEVPVQTIQDVAPDISPALQALLLLLEKKGVLTQDEFLSELKRVVEPGLQVGRHQT